MSKELFEAMAQSIIDGEEEDAVELAQQAIEQGVEPLDAINQGFVVGLDEVGTQFGGSRRRPSPRGGSCARGGGP